MIPNQPYKACPKCQTSAVLDAQFCQSCGHKFRTQFTPPDQTQVFNSPQQPPPPPQPPAQQPYIPPPPHMPQQPYIPQQPFQQPQYGYGYGQVPPGWISVPPGTHSVFAAVALNLCCVVSFGQFYNRQYAKGVVWLLIVVVLAFFTLGFSSLLTYPLGAIDAGLIAAKLNRGQAVRDWECM